MSNYMKHFKSLVLASVLFLGGSCTDLVVENRDSFSTTDTQGVFTGVNATATLESAYNDLRQWTDQANIYALYEVASDELLVPTRGTDWGDNGVWRTLHQHTWDATHVQVLATWNNLNRNNFKIAQILDSRTTKTAQQAAEARFLRALNTFFLLDLFRQVPERSVDATDEENPRVLTVQEVVTQITGDLDAAIAGLPSVAPSGNTLKASKAAAHFLKAKFLLNKHIYLNASPAPADMNGVIAAVDAIESEGYSLQGGNYFDIFRNTSDSETILWTDGGVGNRMWNGLHYNQNSPDNAGGGWNGFSTYADFYSKFQGAANSNEPGNGQEPRRGFVPTDGSNLGIGFGFLVGQQYDETGAKLKDRAGNDLVFTKDFPGLAGNNERTGIRIIKYHPVNGGFTNHYILFRFADAHLMKAEAILRGGTSSDTALGLYNELRAIRGAAAAASVTLDAILDERGRELYAEGWRRMDQVRFGRYNVSYGYMTNTDASRNVYPIPSVALSSNPNLVQNPGY